MRCYKGKCRLADNPEEIACNAITLTDSENASDSSMSTAVVITPTIVKEENETTPSGFGKFFSNFSWQWLAFAGIILLVAVALIIASIARAKKDPWKASGQAKQSTVVNSINQANKSAELQQSEEITKSETTKESTETIKIPEDKPLQF
jgi:hypothetical protein